jgi:hypothetical protein
MMQPFIDVAVAALVGLFVLGLAIRIAGAFARRRALALLGVRLYASALPGVVILGGIVLALVPLTTTSDVAELVLVPIGVLIALGGAAMVRQLWRMPIVW